MLDRSLNRPVARPAQVCTVLLPEMYETFLAIVARNERSVAQELRIAVREYIARQTEQAA